jgi:hypothetical protein
VAVTWIRFRVWGVARWAVAAWAQIRFRVQPGLGRVGVYIGRGGLTGPCLLWAMPLMERAAYRAMTGRYAHVLGWAT